MARRAAAEVDEDADDAFDDPEDGETVVAPPPPKPPRRATAAASTSEPSPDEKFNKKVMEANGDDGTGNLFDFYAIDVTYEGTPVCTVRGRECRFEFEDGDRDPRPSYAGLSQRVAKGFWDGTSQVFTWALRTQSGQSAGRGPIVFTANPKRQAEYAAEVAAMRERATRSAPSVDGAAEERRRREAEERAAKVHEEEQRFAKMRRRREEEDEDEEEVQPRRRPRSLGETPGAPGMPSDPYVYQMERRLDEDRRKADDQSRAIQQSMADLTRSVAALAERVAQPAPPAAPVPSNNPFASLSSPPRGYEYVLHEGMPVLRAETAPTATPTASGPAALGNPFGALPQVKGHEYVILEGVPVLRPIPAAPPPKETEDQEYEGALRSVKKIRRIVDEGARFFGDPGKGEGGTSSDAAPQPTKRTYEEIPDGNGGAAWRVVIDPETGLPSRDPSDILNVNGDIVLREGKKLLSNVFEAWKASKTDSSGGQRTAASLPTGDTSVLDKD
jgi:hypothetical protein